MDTLPSMPSAGIGHYGDNESVAFCLHAHLDPSRTATHNGNVNEGEDQYGENDIHTRRYRESFKKQVGQRFIHPGLVGAKLPSEEFRYGITSKSASSDRAGDCLSFYTQPQSELQTFLQEQKESHYRSHIREPLGKSYIRGHTLPKQYTQQHLNTNGEEFRFGIQSDTSESAKNLIYASAPPPYFRPHGGKDTSEINQQYTPDKYHTDLRRTTTQNAPLEEERLITRPVNREYNWPSGVDPAQHRFGSKAKGGEVHVEHVLQQPDLLDRTHIGSKKIQDFKATHNDHLGRGRGQRGALLQNNAEHLIFGRPGSHEGYGARECIQGAYTKEEQLPDRNLGVSTRKITELEYVPAKHQARAFGLPSVRADREPPKLKSVANDMNFGDESNGKGLIYPSPFAFEGVNEEDFLKQRTPQQIRGVFSRLGVEFKDGEFYALCGAATQQYGVLSLDAFRHVWNQVRLGLRCVDCSGELCQHEDCRVRSCAHDERSNHAPQSRHAFVKPNTSGEKTIKPAGFSNNYYPARMAQ